MCAMERSHIKNHFNWLSHSSETECITNSNQFRVSDTWQQTVLPTLNTGCKATSILALMLYWQNFTKTYLILQPLKHWMHKYNYTCLVTLQSAFPYASSKQENYNNCYRHRLKCIYCVTRGYIIFTIVNKIISRYYLSWATNNGTVHLDVLQQLAFVLL